MKQCSLFILACLCTTFLLAQSTDFLVLKKGGKKIQSFFKGSNIQFTTTTGAYRDAVITAIKNDSIFLQEFVVQKLITNFGTFINDTLGSFRYAYHYRDIKYFSKEHKKFNLFNSGASLFGGGLLLTAGSSVVYLTNKEKFSNTLFFAGLGGTAVGYLFTKIASKGITIGKNKYKLQYINLSVK
ncbi:hypothetical protein ACFOWM_09910 [Ferruginibacter yonginensis]|uniref:Uncharacterized protein n=1 Tax=Ferruginibacter yonginensis TaxID=1310416 RepID=A0ABV8QU32_9BACT